MTDKPKAPPEPLKEGGVKTPDPAPPRSKAGGMVGEAAPDGAPPGGRNDDEGGMVGEG